MSKDDLEAAPRQLTDQEKITAVQKYLRRLGNVSESVLSGGYELLVPYFQGRLD